MSVALKLEDKLESESSQSKEPWTPESSNNLVIVQSLFRAYYAQKLFTFVKIKIPIPLAELFTVFSSFKNHFSNHLHLTILDYLEKSGLYFKEDEAEKFVWSGPITTDLKHFYYGETDDQKIPHGFGVLISFDSIYEGYFSNGNFDKKGRMIGIMQGVYDGLWKSGLKNGIGTMTYWNCSKYSGDWENNQKHGKGMLEELDYHYEGSFENDLKSGYGEQTYTNDIIYKGNFVNGFFEGIGTLIKKQSNENYEGEFKCGLYHGKGTWVMSDGWTYVGDFWNGKRSGFGTLKTNIERYECEWRNDAPFGEYNHYTTKKNYALKGFWKNSIPINHMDEVVNNMFLGNFLAATNEEWLREIGIKYIIRVLDDECVELLPGFFYFYIKAKDSKTENITKYLPEVLDWIEKILKNKEKLLVHCYAGISRSPTIVIAFIMKQFGKSLEEAYQYLKEKRSCIRPNKGFLKQLKELDFKSRI